MKIISYIMMALGFLGWIALYPLTVFLKDGENLDSILFITGYIFIIIFVGGYLINVKFRKQTKENR